LHFLSFFIPYNSFELLYKNFFIYQNLKANLYNFYKLEYGILWAI